MLVGNVTNERVSFIIIEEPGAPATAQNKLIALLFVLLVGMITMLDTSVPPLNPIKPTGITAKVPPHSIEAEQSVLGALMLDHRAWDQVSDRVHAQDFYRNDHRVIFEAIIDLVNRNQPFDVLTIAETLKSHGKLNSIPTGEAYLYELAQNTPSAANAAAYADIVRERSILRQLVSISTDVTNSVFQPEGKDSKELLDAAERLIFQVSEQHNNVVPAHKISVNYYQKPLIVWMSYIIQKAG